MPPRAEMILNIEHIDAIARKKKGDAIYLEFTECVSVSQAGKSKAHLAYDWKSHPGRTMIISWLNTEQIYWKPCAPFAVLGTLPRYSGQIYIDLPVNEDDPSFKRLQTFLEHSDGTPKFSGVNFNYLAYDDALQNAAHDDPGFWDKQGDWF